MSKLDTMILNLQRELDDYRVARDEEVEMQKDTLLDEILSEIDDMEEGHIPTIEAVKKIISSHKWNA